MWERVIRWIVLIFWRNGSWGICWIIVWLRFIRLSFVGFWCFIGIVGIVIGISWFCGSEGIWMCWLWYFSWDFGGVMFRLRIIVGLIDYIWIIWLIYCVDGLMGRNLLFLILKLVMKI